jgi:hypothetical protein
MVNNHSFDSPETAVLHARGAKKNNRVGTPNKFDFDM